MNRAELKAKAKEMIKGNKWFIWKPFVIYLLASFVIGFVAGVLDSALGLSKTTIDEFTGVATTSGGIFTSIAGIVVGICGCALAVGYAMYILSFVRGKKLEIRDIIDFAKKHWVVAVLTSILVGLIVCAGMILLVVPGIIASIGLYYYQEVCADNPEMKATEIVKKSWNMTKGHKADLFVLMLSFMGWSLLASLTFGILYIWLYPYMLITFTLAYEDLKKAA